MYFSVKLTAKDVFFCTLYNTYRSYQGLMSVLAGVLLIALANVCPGMSSGYRLGLTALGVALPLSRPLTLLMEARAAVARMEEVQREDIYRLDEEGLVIVHNRVETRIAWKKLCKVLELRDYYYIYAAPTRFMVIPKAELDPKTCDEFRNFLREHGANYIGTN